MTKVVCIDSNICIWGIKKEGDQKKIPYATKFLSDLENNGTKILLPSPVIIELLSHLKNDEQKNKILALLDNHRIIVKPLDKLATLKCGELLYKTFTDTEIIAYTKKHKVDKSKIKFDALITAIAIVNKCNCIYTDNYDDFIRYSHGEINIQRMPETILQTDLFGNPII